MDFIEVRDTKVYGYCLDDDAKALFDKPEFLDEQILFVAKVMLIAHRWFNTKIDVDDIPLLIKDEEINNMNDLRKEFENISAQNFHGKPAFGPDGQCAADEEVDLKDYPSHTEALYAKLIAPHVSGIYISRWDIKDIALAAGDSMAIHPRKRMFELLMKYATSKENMQNVLDALESHMEDKITIYKNVLPTTLFCRSV